MDLAQGVTRCLMNHGSAIRVPLHTAERMRKIEAVRTALRQELGEEPDRRADRGKVRPARGKSGGADPADAGHLLAGRSHGG